MMIRQALNDGVPTQATIAQELSLGERTLRRRLQREGTHFRGLLDLARRQIACEMLASTRVSLTQLAVQLGFAHQSAFTRAFRRWFGMTPSAWRSASRAYEPAYQAPGSGAPSSVALRLRSIA